MQIIDCLLSQSLPTIFRVVEDPHLDVIVIILLQRLSKISFSDAYLGFCPLIHLCDVPFPDLVRQNRFAFQIEIF